MKKMICIAAFLSVSLVSFAQVGSCNEAPTALDQLGKLGMSVLQEIEPAAPLPEASVAEAFVAGKRDLVCKVTQIKVRDIKDVYDQGIQHIGEKNKPHQVITQAKANGVGIYYANLILSETQRHINLAIENLEKSGDTGEWLPNIYSLKEHIDKGVNLALTAYTDEYEGSNCSMPTTHGCVYDPRDKEFDGKTIYLCSRHLVKGIPFMLQTTIHELAHLAHMMRGPYAYNELLVRECHALDMEFVVMFAAGGRPALINKYPNICYPSGANYVIF